MRKTHDTKKLSLATATIARLTRTLDASQLAMAQGAKYRRSIGTQDPTTNEDPDPAGC